ncbi:TPA: hypothetical protein DEF17_08555, partial [bacterium]|nr:hypothetical protein [bacterium]
SNLIIAAVLIPSMLLTFSIGFGASCRRAIHEYFLMGMPEDAVIVSKSLLAFGPLNFSSSPLPPNISDEIRKMSGIKNIAIEESLLLPAQVNGSIFGRAYGSDVAVIGLDSSSVKWLSPELSDDEFVDTNPLPVVVPELILEAYNNSFAEPNGLPRLSKSAFLGRRFQLVAGASSLNVSENGSIVVEAELVGFTKRRDVFGLIVPRKFIQRVHDTMKVQNREQRIFVFYRTPADGRRIAESLKSQGLSVNAPWERLKSMEGFDITFGIFSSLLALLFGILSMVSSFFAAAAGIFSKKNESKLYHQLGLSRFSIVKLLIKKLIFSEVIGAVAGSIIGILILASSEYFPILHVLNLIPTTYEILFGAVTGAIVPAAAGICGAFAGGISIIPPWRSRAE